MYLSKINQYEACAIIIIIIIVTGVLLLLLLLLILLLLLDRLPVLRTWGTAFVHGLN